MSAWSELDSYRQLSDFTLLSDFSTPAERAFRAAETVSPRALSWFVSDPTSQQQVETSLRSERHGDDIQPAGKKALDGATGKDGRDQGRHKAIASDLDSAKDLSTAEMHPEQPAEGPLASAAPGETLKIWRQQMFFPLLFALSTSMYSSHQSALGLEKSQSMSAADFVSVCWRP